jgi:hypothetical protein
MTQRLSKGERRQQARLGKQYCNFDLGSDAPDPGPAAAASEYAADKGFELGTAQQTEAKRQYDLNYAAFQPIIKNQTDIMNVNAANAAEDRQYSLSTYRPLEQKMVKDATDFNTDAERERLAGIAGADVNKAFSSAREQSTRANNRRGINPAVGGNDIQLQIAQAGGTAAAENNARTAARNEGVARMTNAVGLGKGLTGAAQGAYALSLQAGTGAGSSIMQPGAAYMNGLNQGAGTIMQGAGIQSQGLTSLYGAQASYEAQAGGSMAGLMGAGLGAAAMYFSDRRLKRQIQQIGTTPGGTRLYIFQYIWSDDWFIGVMADEVPEAAVNVGGFLMVDYSKVH